MSFLDNLFSNNPTAAQVAGKVGKVLGSGIIGSPWGGGALPDLGISEQLQRYGGYFAPQAHAADKPAGSQQTQQTLITDYGNQNVQGPPPGYYSQPGGGSNTGQIPQPQPQPSQPSGPSAEELQRQQVSRAYNEVTANLDRLAGLLPGMRESQEGTVNRSADLQRGNIQEQLALGNQKLDASAAGVRDRQVSSVRDLASNMRNLLQAGNTYLGNYGAGDSSAANLYSYALGKEANRGRADILKQANQQYADIDMKRLDIEQTANNEINKINLWKEDSLGKIGQWFDSQMFEIEIRRGEARFAKEQAKMDILNQAISHLRSLDNAAAQYSQQVQSWATDRLAQINNVRMEMGQMSTYNPQAIVAQELQGMGNIQAGGIGGDFFNPYAQRRNEEQQRLGRLFG